CSPSLTLHSVGTILSTVLTALRDGLPPSIGQERAAALSAGACLVGSAVPPSGAGPGTGREQALPRKSKPVATMIGRLIGNRFICFLPWVCKEISFCARCAGGRAAAHLAAMAYSRCSVITYKTPLT